MLLQIIVYPPWLQFIWDQFNLFLDWFAAQDIAVQILVGVLIFMGLIAVTQIIKGVVWIAKESVKASLLVTFISLYLVFSGFKIAIVAIIDVKKVNAEWKHTENNIKWLINRFYPIKKKYTKKKSEPIVVVEQPEPVKPPQVYVIKEREQTNQQDIQESKPDLESKKPQVEYCHNCGCSFSMKMFEMLHTKGFAFCDQCGAKYTAE
jgi:hypothetical protein